MLVALTDFLPPAAVNLSEDEKAPALEFADQLLCSAVYSA